MKVLGIDQASHTGFAVLDGAKLTQSGTVVFKGGLGSRLSGFQKWFRNIVQTEVPELVVYEKPHFRGYAATVSGAAMIGIMELACFEFGIATMPVHSATLKKSASGAGKANKAKMTDAANTLMDLKLRADINNDEADAIHLAVYGGKNFGRL